MTRKLCPVCKGPIIKKEVGRHKNACDEHYALYRRAVNMLAAAEHRATTKDLPFDLDMEWMLEQLQGRCPKLGFKFRTDYAGENYRDRHPLCPSVDKIDPTKGYLKNNCEVVCWWYNVAKQTFSEEQMYNLCSIFIDYQRSKNND